MPGSVEVESLYPEQVRALDYLRRKGSVADLQILREQVSAAFAKLELILSGVPTALRDRRPRDGVWCVHEILDHLVLTNERALTELHDLLDGRQPEGEPIPAGLISENPLAIGWDDLYARLRAVHSEFLDAVCNADESVSLSVRAPIVMVVKVPGDDGRPTPIAWTYELDWKAYAQAFRVHTIEHVEQIKRTVAELDA